MTLTREGARLIIADAVNKAGGVSAYSRKHDISEGYISNVVNGRVKPGPRISKSVGLEETKSSVWAKIGPVKAGK